MVLDTRTEIAIGTLLLTDSRLAVEVQGIGGAFATVTVCRGSEIVLAAQMELADGWGKLDLSAADLPASIEPGDAVRVADSTGNLVLSGMFRAGLPQASASAS